METAMKREYIIDNTLRQESQIAPFFDQKIHEFVEKMV